MTGKLAKGSMPTKSGQKYINQLCKHWSHKAGAKIDAEAGSIAFEGGNSVLLTAEPDQLYVTASVGPDGDLEHWKGVVEAHLKRFAFREDFALNWDANTD